MIQSFVHRSTSRPFLKFFGIILAAELTTMFVAWLLLDVNTKRWVQEKAMHAMRISQQVASSGDWSLVGKVPVGRDSALGARYGKRLSALDDRYFPHVEGSLYLVKLVKGEEYALSGDDSQLSDTTEANQTEVDAYAKRRATYSSAPIVDMLGTYIGGYVPILHDGKVLGLVATEIDSSPLSDFRSVVRTAFWLSIIPAIFASLIVSYVLASRYIEPMAMLRAIDETAKNQQVLSEKGEEDVRWLRLTQKEKQVAELARRGLTGKEIAGELDIRPETVKQHLKNIKEKTGWSKVDLAVQAEGRRIASTAATTV